MTAAAFQATFSDFRLVKGRKVAQIVLECPLEQADAALLVLGGVPRPDAERWVAVARLDVQPAKVEKRDTRTSQRAAMLCQSPMFANWLCGAANASLVEVAERMRGRLRVLSRADLDTDPEARARFEALEREYQEAMR